MAVLARTHAEVSNAILLGPEDETGPVFLRVCALQGPPRPEVAAEAVAALPQTHTEVSSAV